MQSRIDKESYRNVLMRSLRSRTRLFLTRELKEAGIALELKRERGKEELVP